MDTLKEDQVDFLPPTKIKRQYKCGTCPHVTINPRDHLKHRKYVHGESKIKIVECPLCQYACQYRQKLIRHMKLVHKDFLPNSVHMIRQSRQMGSQSSPSSPPWYNFQNEQFLHPTSSPPSWPSIQNNYSNDGDNLVVFNETNMDADEPLDLSYSPETKKLLKLRESRQAYQK